MNKYYTITTNALTDKSKYSINYSDVALEMKRISAIKFSSKEEYLEWVAEWKKFHAEIVASIKYFRAMKNRMKYDNAYANSMVDNKNVLQYHKKWFGKIARDLYELRREMKEVAAKQREFNKMAA